MKLVDALNDFRVSDFELGFLSRCDVVPAISVFDLYGIEPVSQEYEVRKVLNFSLVATHSAYRGRVLSNLVLEFICNLNSALASTAHVELIDNEKEGSAHVQIELLFDVLQRLHWYVRFTKQRSKYAAIEQTLAGTWYPRQHPSGASFLSCLVYVSQPIKEAFKLFVTIAQYVVYQLIGERTLVLDLWPLA